MNSTTLRRWLIGLYALLAIIIALVGQQYAQAQISHIWRSAQAELDTVADLKTRQLILWRSERIGDGQYFMQSPLLDAELSRWLEAPTAVSPERLVASLEATRTSWHYVNAALVARDGTVLLSLDPEAQIVDAAIEQGMADAFALAAPQLVDLHLHTETGAPHMAVIVPIFPGQVNTGRPLGALVLEIDPETYLYPLLDTWPTANTSAVTLLVRREGDQVLYLNRLHQPAETTLAVFTQPITRTESLAVMAVTGRQGLVEGIDEHDVAVIAVVNPVPDSPWYLIVKEDRAQVAGEVRSTLVNFGLILALIFLTALSFGLFFYQERARRHERALQATQAALNAKTAELETFFIHSTSLLCISDIDGRFRRLNPAWAHQMGWDPDAMVGLPYTDYLHPDDAVATSQRVEQLIDQKAQAPFSNRYRHADGSYHWLEWRSVVFGTQIYSAARDVTAERAAAETLRRSEERLRLAVELSDMIVAVSDRDLRYTWAFNTQSLGLEPAQVIGNREDELFGADPVNDFTVLRQHVMATGVRLRQEMWMDLKDGRRVFDVIFDPFFDEAGAVSGMTVVALEITERKRVEDALRRSEEQLRLAAGLIGMTIAVVDRDLRYTWVYNSAEGLPGPEERLGRRDDEIFGHENAANIIASRTHVLTTGQRLRCETTLLQEDQRCYFDVVFDPIFDETGAVAGMIGVGVDITERKRVEEALRNSRDELRRQTDQITQIIESVPDGVILLDAQGHVLLANPPARKHLVHLTATGIDAPLTQLGDRHLAEVMATATSDQWLELHAGLNLYEAMARTVRPDETLQGWVLVVRDVTQERAIQASLQRQEQLAAVGQLAAGIAHDFNNILAVISLYTELTLHAAQLPETVRERLGVILHQSQQAAELVQQILDFSRQSVMVRRLFALDEFLTEQVKLLRRTLPESIRIELSVTPALHGYIVDADKTRLAQMVFNLATNARDAMPGGGVLSFELAQRSVPAGLLPNVPAVTPGNWIELRIRDTGSGIAPEHMPHVFSPFYTTKAPGKGSGLGLPQVHGIVHQHGGHLHVESTVDVGTTFVIYLPAQDAPVAEGATPSGVIARGQGETILIVEDEDAVRTALAATLRHWGYAVLEASHGEEALTLLAGAQDIRLVLSDVVMPVMGGVELVRAMRSRELATPVILLTGHPLHHDPDQLPDGYVYTWLTKPPAPDQLSQALAQALATPV